MSFSETPGVSHPVLYSTYGACCTRVEVDCLTGDHKVCSRSIIITIIITIVISNSNNININRNVTI